MRNWLRTIGGLIVLTAAATYVISEWAVWQKSGLHDVRAAADVVEVVPVPVGPERVALQAQVDRLAATFAEFRAAKERQIDDLERLIATLTRQIQVLTAQRMPVEQVAALRAASRPVRWAKVEQDGVGNVTGFKSSEAPGTQQANDAAPPLDLRALAREEGFTWVEVRR